MYIKVIKKVIVREEIRFRKLYVFTFIMYIVKWLEEYKLKLILVFSIKDLDYYI